MVARADTEGQSGAKNGGLGQSSPSGIQGQSPWSGGEAPEADDILAI